MKKLNIQNKEINFLILFGLLALLFISMNFTNNSTTQETTIFEEKLPKSSAITINIISPSTNENFSATLPDFVVEFSGDTVNKSWYTLNTNQTKHFFIDNGTINGWQFLTDGSVNITFYANNSLSVEDLAWVIVNKDTLAPSIDSIVLPLPNTNHSAPPSYSLSITETNLDKIWYSLDGGSTNYTGAASGTISSAAWSAESDGSVTITFYVNDTAGNWDMASVTIYKDTVAPSIDIIVSPLSGSNHSASPSYSLSITELEIDEIWYSLDGGSTNYTGAASGTISSAAWSAESDGSITITFYVNDTAGNWDSASVDINKDTADPSINSIISPLPNTNHSAPPSYSLSITETNLDEIWYSLDGGSTNYTGATSGTISTVAWSAESDGSVTITFYVNDTAGNWDMASVTIYKDTLAPSIDSIVSPLFGSNHSASPSYSLSITELEIDEIWYSLDGGSTNYTGAASGTISSAAWSAESDGSITITFYVNDTAGNWDMASVTINKDTLAPSIDSIVAPLPNTNHSAPPSYSLTITETNIDEIWYSLNGGTDNYTGAASGTISSVAWNAESDGSITITFYVNDTTGKWDMASVTIYKDTIAPSIDSIISPLPNTNHSAPPSYSLSITELEIDEIWYSLDGGSTNFTGAASGMINSTAWNAESDGSLTITFYVNDTAGNWDTASVTINKDTLAPSIDSISSPSSLVWFSTTPPTYSLLITELNLDEIWYTLDSGINNYTGAASGTIDSTAWNNAPQAAVTITFYVNDTAGNWDTASVVVNKDTTIPQINIMSPGASQIFGAKTPNFIVEIFDYTLDTMWYTFDGFTNFTFIANGTIDQAAWDALSNGAVTITFYANDSFGYTNSSSQNFFKNAFAPDINVVSPSSGSYYGTTAPSFVVEIIDTDLDTMWYTIDGGVTNITFITNGTIDQTEWNALPFNEGAVSLVFYANDTAGNSASVLTIIYKDTVAPTINILTPILLQLLGVNAPSFSVEIDDPILDAMWYSLDNGVTNYTFLVNSTFNTLTWGSLPNGTATIYFFAIDLVGNEAFDSVIVRVDKITPTLIVNLPVGGTIIETQPTINITVNDVNVDSIWYRVGTTVIPLPLSANNTDQLLNLLLWNALPEGQFTIEFFTNDTAGNLNGPNSVDLTKDISAPIVDIVHPLANATYRTAPQITVTINDVTLDTTWYTILGTNFTFEFTAVLGTNYVSIDQTAWNALSNGDVTIVFYANDSLGRVSSDSITLNRNVPEPFDFIAFLLGPYGLTIIGVIIVAVVVIVLLRRRKVHRTSDKEVRKIESLWD